MIPPVSGDEQYITDDGKLTFAGQILFQEMVKAIASAGSGVSDGDKGDVTVSASGATWTIDAGVVSLSKMADLATSTIIGRVTTGTGVPEALTATQVRTLINVADGANAYVHPNHSGDVTSVADGATTIANDAVTYAKMQNVTANSFLARAAATDGDVSAVALAASQLAGRGSTGDVAAITLGAGLALSGTELATIGRIYRVACHADAGAAIGLINQPNTEQFFVSTARSVWLVDLSGFTEYRLVARVMTPSASANNPRLYARYKTGAISTAVGDYSEIGATAETVSLAAAGMIKTPWTGLVAGAIADDVLVTVLQNGGDGVEDPGIAHLTLEFR